MEILNKIYRKIRIKEIPVEIEKVYDHIPNSSILFLTNNSDFRESIFNNFDFDFWKNTTQEVFSNCILNLFFTGKIKVNYCLDRKYYFFISIQP